MKLMLLLVTKRGPDRKQFAKSSGRASVVSRPDTERMPSAAGLASCSCSDSVSLYRIILKQKCESFFSFGQ